MTRLLPHFFTIYLAVVMMAVAGCRETETPDHATLLKAERFIDIWQLDSAAAVLDGVDTAPLGSKADSALYALNYIRLKKMRGIILPDDSLATIATDFYTRIGDVHRSMLAWYYRTCILFDNRHYAEAAVAAGKMKKYAELDCDHLYLARYGDIMANCAELVGNNVGAARYYTYSFNQFKENIPGNDNYLNFFFERARNSWLKAGRIDSALVLSRTMKPIILSMTDTNTVSKWISNHATMLLNNRIRDYEGARALYREMDSIGAPYWPEASNHRIARGLIKALADHDTAAWRKALADLDKYGSRDIAYGYFVNETSPEGFFEVNSELLEGDESFPDEEYGAVFKSAPEPENEESDGRLWTRLLLGAVALAAIGLAFVFFRR